MNHYQDRKRQRSKYKNAPKIPARIKLAQVNELKAQIVADFNRGNLRSFDTRLKFLRENQVNHPDKLAKSLCDLAENIADSEIQLELLAEAVVLNGHDTVALTSYGTALANHNVPEKAFEQFEKSLAIDSDNTVALNSYGTALANHNVPEKAFEQFEKSLAIEANNTVTLNSYGTALANHNHPEKAFVQFEKSLAIEPNDTVALTSYGTALANQNVPEKAFEQFEKSLAIEPNNTVALTSYGTALANHNVPEKAFEQFEQSLAIEPNDTVALTSYGTALANHNEPEKAFVQFEKSLAIDSENTVALTSYGTALANHNVPEKAFVQFEKSLTIEPDNTTTLNSYGTALANHNVPEKAFEQFEKSLAIDSDDTTTLTSYGTALANHNVPEKAFEQFEKSLAIEPNNTVALTSYGTALANHNDPEKAFELFEKSLAIEPNNRITLFIYGTQLGRVGEYDKAIEIIEKMKVAGLQKSYLDFICLILGRLYYLIGREKKGDEYFNLLIQHAKNMDVALLKNAQHILAVTPYNPKGIDLLIKITEASPIYTQALKALTLNLEPKAYFEMFNQPIEEEPIDNSLKETVLKDTEMLNRSMYHNIKNEVSILTEIIHGIIAHTQDEMLLEMRDQIQTIFQEIEKRRHLEETKVKEIPADNYDAIIAIISETAHHIVDFVNNELAILQEDIISALRKLSEDDPRREGFNELKEQVEITQNALNNLKSVNEGINIQYKPLKINELFKKWQNNPKLGNATISVEIENPELEIDVDGEKIKSFLSELVENSLKHNTKKADLQIRMASKVVNSLDEGQSKKMPGHRKYLKICYRDNGKGISRKRKEWVFLPLNSTLKESSGLGLFMIRRTLTKMKGYIEETGKKGVNFEMGIPNGETI
jgi:Tfp pilus assembly protein PilF/anti-sigma regulatory factor (Ser/Thr protein kinase)